VEVCTGALGDTGVEVCAGLLGGIGVEVFADLLGGMGVEVFARLLGGTLVVAAEVGVASGKPASAKIAAATTNIVPTAA
jgi:hypothetical protein